MNETELTDDADFGISITTSIEGGDRKNIILRGKFRVAYNKNGIKVQGAQVLKHVVLVTMRSGNYIALAPFREVVVFDDDIQENDQGCSGYFNINVMDHITFSGAGGSDYYILCSIGTCLSNTVKVTAV